MSKKGFTVVEVLVVAVIIVSVFGILYNATNGGTTQIAMTPAGLVSSQFINGMSFVVGPNGSPTQVLNQNGGGVPCN